MSKERTNKRTETLARDCISRQAAIDALADYIHNVDKVYSTGKLSTDDCKDAAKSVLEDLPSAQPEIIRCKGCKLFGQPQCLMCFDGYDWTEPDGYCYMAERREE